MAITAIPLPMDKIADFCHKWQVLEFSLFSSVLRDDFGSESDVDVMVQFHPEAHPTLFDLSEMEDELKTLFQRGVDLVTRKGIEASHNPLRRQAMFVLSGFRKTSQCTKNLSKSAPTRLLAGTARLNQCE